MLACWQRAGIITGGSGIQPGLKTRGEKARKKMTEAALAKTLALL